MFTRWLLILMTLITLVNCSRESEPAERPIMVKPKSGSCLHQFGENYERYMAGQMDDEQVAAFWDCTNETITEFARVTTGDRANGDYTPQAVWRFLKKYYFTELNVTPDLLASIMEIKRVLVGGSAALITEAELYKLIQFIGEVKISTIEMRPHIRVITQQEKDIDPKQLAAAKMAMGGVIKRMAMWIEKQRQEYTFAQMRGLVEALAKNSDDPEGWKSWIGAVQLLSQAKVVTVNLPAEAVLPGQWGPFFNTVGSAFALYTDWKYQISGRIMASLAQPAIRDMAKSLVGIVEQGVKVRGKSGGIPLEEFDKLFLMIGKSGWLGTNVKEDALVKGFRWGLARLFTPRSEVRFLPKIAMLEISNIQLMRELLADWEALAEFSMTSGSGKSDSARVNEFISVLNSSWPLVIDKYGRVSYPDVGQTAKYDPPSLLILSWQFLTMSWLRDSYVPEKQIKWAPEHMHATVAEVLPLIQNFGFLVQQKPEVFKRIMMEGDVFLPASDGDLLISTAEATHFFNGLVSAITAGFVWDAVVGKNCGEPADPSCYRDVLYIQKDLLVAHMPRLKQHFASMSIEKWRELFIKIEVTALGAPETVPWDLGDRNLVWMLMGYLENFMQKYDSGLNESINLSEAKVIYKYFSGNLAKLVEPFNMPQEDIYPFFTFMMKYGEPHFKRDGGQIEFDYWKRHPETWPFESDRGVLVNILYELSQLRK